MARHLHYYKTQEEFEEAYNSGQYNEPWTSFVDDSSRLISFDKGYDGKKEPLTFEILEDGHIFVYYDGQDNSYTREIYWSINDGEWNSDTPENGHDVEIEVNAGDTVQFFGYSDYMTIIDSSSYEYYNYFGSDCEFNVCGNIMSLLDGDDFQDMERFPDESIRGVFMGLFNSCDLLIDASMLVIPVKEVTGYAYGSMFYNCISLTTAPELPATTLAYSCYSSMFRGCTSLTTSPELPATTLANYCYEGMFNDCTSLTTAPELPATALTSYCYYNMFYGCSAITTAPSVLPATTLAYNCYTNMFYGCSSLATAPELPATTLASSCYYQMFSGCIALATAPELPATTLTSNCYWGMFSGCTSLNYIKCLATNISASYCTQTWVSGVASTGTFVKAPSMTGWTIGINGIPNNWTINV